MKYLCELCDRLVEATRFRMDGAELVLTCGKCGNDTRARSAEAIAQPVVASGSTSSPSPAAQAPPPPGRVVSLHAVPPPTFGGEDPFAVPEDHCPKCVAPRPAEALSCPQCGLVFANFVAEEHRPPEELAAAWTELAARWDDLAAHDRALAGATARGELAGMGRLYRIRLARQPKDPIALRGRDEVLRIAASTSPFVAGKLAAAAARTRETLLLVSALFLVGSVALLAYWLFYK